MRSLLIACCLSSSIWLASGVSSSTSPNILLITIDTLRLSNIGFYGNTAARTPNLDKLASQSVVFDHYYSTANCTMPSHLSIFSGKMPSTFGIFDNEKYDITSRTMILPEHLRRNGYKSYGVTSAFFLGNDWLSGFGRQFDSFVSPLDGEFKADEVKKAFRSLIPQLKTNKFFCWLHFYDPHVPYDPPKTYGDLFNGYAEDGPAITPAEEGSGSDWLRSYGVRTKWQARARYHGEVAYADAQIGEVLKLLRANSLHENTIIFVVADHGELLGSHDFYYVHFTLYEQTIHVPLIVYGPNFSHRRIQEFVSGLDVAPTIMEIAGAKIPTDMEGLSALPLLKGDHPVMDRFIYAQAADNFSLAVIKPPYKMIFNTPASEMPYPVELYQILNDPYERRNLIGSEHATAKLIEDHAKRFSREPKLGQPSVNETEKEQLKALGYLQ